MQAFNVRQSGRWVSVRGRMVSDHFGAHQESGRWVLTHLGSGFQGGNCRTLAIAKRLAGLLEENVRCTWGGIRFAVDAVPCSDAELRAEFKRCYPAGYGIDDATADMQAAVDAIVRTFGKKAYSRYLPKSRADRKQLESKPVAKPAPSADPEADTFDNGHFTMSQDVYFSHENDMIGRCVSCGAERFQTEPDARNYPCESCGERKVFGTQELLIMGRIVLV